MGTNLFELISGNSVRQLQLVLETGCEVNCRNDRMETPLMWSLIMVPDDSKRLAMMRMLLIYGAEVNFQNARGQTAFMYACILNQAVSIVILLEEYSVDLNIQDSEGNTGFMYACALGHAQIADYLMEVYTTKRYPLDINAQNHEGLSAMQHALEGHNSDIVHILSKVISLAPGTIDQSSFGSEEINHNQIQSISNNDLILTGSPGKVPKSYPSAAIYEMIKDFEVQSNFKEDNPELANKCNNEPTQSTLGNERCNNNAVKRTPTPTPDVHQKSSSYRNFLRRLFHRNNGSQQEPSPSNNLGNEINNNDDTQLPIEAPTRLNDNQDLHTLDWRHTEKKSACNVESEALMRGKSRSRQNRRNEKVGVDYEDVEEYNSPAVLSEKALEKTVVKDFAEIFPVAVNKADVGMGKRSEICVPEKGRQSRSESRRKSRRNGQGRTSEMSDRSESSPEPSNTSLWRDLNYGCSPRLHHDKASRSSDICNQGNGNDDLSLSTDFTESANRPSASEESRSSSRSEARENIVGNMYLSPERKAKILARETWSTYGDPLPNITGSTYHPSSLLPPVRNPRRHYPTKLYKMDPDIWRILEPSGFKTQSRSKWRGTDLDEAARDNALSGASSHNVSEKRSS